MVVNYRNRVKEFGLSIKPFILTKKLKTSLIVLTILLCVYTACLLTITSSWAISNLNDEAGITPLPHYQDENITMTFIGTAVSSEDNTSISTSEYVTRVGLRNDAYLGWLDICYMEVLVWNGTTEPYGSDWSLNLTSGSKRSNIASSPHGITIPEHTALETIFLQINLLSTNHDNTTYSTPSPLNGMTFNYTVYYSDDEIAEDFTERQLVASNAAQNALLWFVILAMGFWISMQQIDGSTEGTIILTDSEKPDEQIDYYSGRIDSLDQERHNLLVEIQILVVILGGIAAYSTTQTTLYQFYMSSIILAIPLIFTIIILMMGPERTSVASLVRSNNQELLKFLKKEMIRKTKFIQKIKMLIAMGSFASLNFIVLGLNASTGKYQNLWIVITSMMKIYLILVTIIIFAITIYIAFSKVDVEMN